MRVVVCALAKNEHLYINEWVKHYIDIGIDHIYLFDNDDFKSPYIGDFIDNDYKSKVTIKNVRGIKMPYLQHTIYNNFYSKHNNSFDWCLFCDIDEFLMGVDNVKKWLSSKNALQVRIKWRLFGDDNVIKRDMSVGVKDFFNNVINDNRLSNQSKAFIRGGLKIKIASCHYVMGLKSCLPSGKLCSSNSINIDNYNGEKIFINHYMTKTLDEFINQKLGRGDAVWHKRPIDFGYFFRINEKTQEKIDYIKNMGLEIDN